MWTGNEKLDKLRSKAATEPSGVIKVSIEELNEILPIKNSIPLDKPVILKIVEMIDEELKELSTPKSPFAQPFKEGRIMALQQLRKEIDNNFSA